MDNENCSKCKFSHRLELYDGQCRRYPPIIASITDRYGELNNMFCFPTIDKNDWCGEFKHKLNEK